MIVLRKIGDLITLGDDNEHSEMGQNIENAITIVYNNIESQEAHISTMHEESDHLEL